MNEIKRCIDCLLQSTEENILGIISSEMTKWIVKYMKNRIKIRIQNNLCM